MCKYELPMPSFRKLSFDRHTHRQSDLDRHNIHTDTITIIYHAASQLANYEASVIVLCLSEIWYSLANESVRRRGGALKRAGNICE